MNAIVLSIIAMILGLISLAIDPKEHQGNKKLSILIFMGTLLILNCYFSIRISMAQDEKEKNLEKQNQKLLEITSLGEGYHLLVRGVASYGCFTQEGQVRNGLNNLFLKYAKLNIEIHTNDENNNIYKGAVNQISNPQIVSFFGVEKVEQSDYLKKQKGNSYYFEIIADDIRIRHQDIQYLASENNEEKDQIVIYIKEYDGDKPFIEYYKLAEIYVKEVEIIELNRVVEVDQEVKFNETACKS
ncbi:MAG: hypothetical protein AB4372_14065 [Xenococcus sp. (in: cyanobacteria)]